ncbi:hypothetical protein ILFOPFJJ_05775 [Ensifer psoraleae]|uniref:hypothetical protein n=1 Tax=Sinorhizobium psoraleae TaxID=520838 RepID=UPI001FE3B21C|nr:hypothetical protein [Sinorhizobium psoraleae]NRP74852.1 hypothetical protein [Sinorhizobium psoraleae]
MEPHVVDIDPKQIVPAAGGWVLTVTVEDEIGLRPARGGMLEIDLASFYDQFVRTGRGTASVAAEVDGPEGEVRLSRLLDAVKRRHRGSGKEYTLSIAP